MSEIKPWDRQPTEPDDAWEAFKKYRSQQHPRHAAKVYGYPVADRARWFVDYHWTDRCKAYDLYLEGVYHDEFEARFRDGARAMAEAHLAMLKDARELAAMELEKMRRVSEESEQYGVMKAGELIKLLEASIKLERLVRGESTENVQQSMDLSKLSVDELKLWNDLQEKLEAGDTSTH